MTDKIQKISISEFLFYIYFGIMLITKGLGGVDGTTPFKCALVASSLCVLVKIMLEKYSLLEYAAIVLMLGLGTLIWQISGNQSIIVIMFLIVSLKNIDIQKAFKFAACVWGSSFVILILLHLFNLTSQDFVIHTKFGLGYVIRWALGYSHPNSLQIAYTVLVAYILQSMHCSIKKTAITLILSTIGATYIFMFSLSATGAIMYIMMLLFYCIFYIKAYINKAFNVFETILLNLIFPLCAGSAILAPILLKGKAFDIVNSIMQTRPSLTRYFLTNYGLNLFGLDHTDIAAIYTLDSSYAYLLVDGGTIAFIFFIILYISMINHSIQEFNTNPSIESAGRLAIIFSFAIAAISEPFFFNISYKNVTILYAGSFLWDRLGTRNTDARHVILKLSNNSICQIEKLKAAIIKAVIYIYKAFNYVLHELIKIDVRRIVISVIAALVAVIIYLSVWAMPKAVYALRSSCDTDDNSVSIYLTEEEADYLRDSDDVWFLNYTDEETPMLEFDGSIAGIDTVRGIVTVSILSYAFMNIFIVTV